MTLAEFRDVTAHLDGDRELLCAGAPIAIVWHGTDHVSVDDGEPELPPDAVVLYREDD